MGKFNYKKLLTRCCSAFRKKPKQVEFAGYPNCTFHRTSVVVDYVANTPIPWADVYDQFSLPLGADVVMVTVSLDTGPQGVVFSRPDSSTSTTLTYSPQVLLLPTYVEVFPFSVIGLADFAADTAGIQEGDEPHETFGVLAPPVRDYSVTTETDQNVQVRFEVVWVNAGCCLTFFAS